MRRLILILMISMAAVGAAACGGSSQVDSASEEENGEVATGEQETDEEGNGEETTDDEEENGEVTSLNAFFGFDPNDPDASAAQFARMNMRQQDLVAACMINQGFEYVPAVVPIDAQDFVFDEEDYAREQGFGISIEWRGDSVDSILEQWVDPNQAIVEKLSDSERDAYQKALYGAPTGLEFGSFTSSGSEGEDSATAEEYEPAEVESGSAASDLESAEVESEPTEESLWGGGCMGEANQEVYGKADEVFQELEPMFTELQERLESDPRMVEASKGWTTCMADRGYDFQTVEELWDRGLEEISTRYYELVGRSDPFAGMTEEEVEIFWETSSAEAIDDFYEQHESQTRQDVDQEALAALQQEERDLAVANYECGEKQREIAQEVTQELESKFINENRDTLERARALLDPN